MTRRDDVGELLEGDGIEDTVHSDLSGEEAALHVIPGTID
jgi:hypothetical protein